MTYMNFVEDFFNQIYGVLRTFTIFDAIDIILLAYITYVVINFVKETRAGQLVKGVLLLVVFYFLAVQFNLKAMSFLFQNIFQIGIISLIVLFQPEIRRALERAGRTKVADLNVFGTDDAERMVETWEHGIEQICEAVRSLSKTKTGALIVIERKTRLGEQVDTGVLLHATISTELLLNIFFVNTPLHDGAVIVRDGRILAAACFLPKPQNEELIATNFGSRHRAALGISEVSDAITIVVSEETGTVSTTEDGQMIRNFTPESLAEHLRAKLIPTEHEESRTKKLVKKFTLKKKKKQ